MIFRRSSLHMKIFVLIISSLIVIRSSDSAMTDNDGDLDKVCNEYCSNTIIARQSRCQEIRES